MLLNWLLSLARTCARFAGQDATVVEVGGDPLPPYPR